jgi:hypothetical protein
MTGLNVRAVTSQVSARNLFLTLTPPQRLPQADGARCVRCRWCSTRA